jgi:hypothetical protein
MTAGLLWRGGALATAALLRHRGPAAALPVAGVLAAAGILGTGPARLPAWPESGLPALAFTLAFALLFWPDWPPLASEAAQRAALFGLPAVAWSAFVLRGAPPADVLCGAAILAFVLAAAAAGGSQASGEAGWRRPVLWLLTLGVAAGAGAGLLTAAHSTAPRDRPLLALGAALLAVAAFVPAYLVEGRRVLRELGEEARLGLLPAEDVDVIARPWRRSREPRFGRSDERRTYVKSALLLAVALQQQRRRSGTAERLRQLEVLTFRTRVRRTLDARSGRGAPPLDELTLPA